MKLGFCKAGVLSLLLLSQSSSALRFGTIEANLLALNPGKDNLLGASVVEEWFSDLVPAPNDNLEGAKMDPVGRRLEDVDLDEGSIVLVSFGLDMLGIWNVTIWKKIDLLHNFVFFVLLLSPHFHCVWISCLSVSQQSRPNSIRIGENRHLLSERAGL